MNPNQRLFYSLLATLPAFVLKWQQRDWGTEELQFLLYPVQFLVQVFTGLPARYVKEQGYLFEGFVIEKSCAGLNFLVITWCALAWLSTQNGRNWRVQIGALLLSVPLTYGLCIAANTARIISALWAMRVPGLHGAVAHESLGVVVYLFVLLLACSLFHHLLTHPKHAKLA